MNYQQLTEGQRYQIALLYKEHCSYCEIGQRVGVSKSTVSVTSGVMGCVLP